MPASNAAAVVQEALALRRTHAHAPASEILDLVLRERDVWLDDLFEHMVPPSPFALLVAEAVGDCMSAAEWRAFTGPQVSDHANAVMRQLYRDNVWPEFVRRWGWSPPGNAAQSEPVRYMHRTL